MIGQDNQMANAIIYVCPTCKNDLQSSAGKFSCDTCHIDYPIREGIPDFVSEIFTRKTNPLLTWANKNYKLQASIYERTRYPWRLFLYGEFRSPSFKELVNMITKMIDIDQGMILDVACGPGTLGRRMATSTRVVYGIDISWAMLRKGAAYLKRSQPIYIHFARTKAENLPFKDAQFDAALCGSALHFFADPEITLREVGRTLKEGAPLAVMTLLAGNKRRTWFRRFRDRLLQPLNAHLFQIPELEQIVDRAGFQDFQPHVYGSMILFNVHKRRTS